MGFRSLPGIALLFVPLCYGQLTVGTVEGSCIDEQGRPASARLDVEGPLGRILVLDTDSHGRYSLVLPYGTYVIHSVPLGASCRVRVLPLQTARCDLRAGENVAAISRGIPLAGAYTAAQDLLFQVPAVLVHPLEFEALGTIRLPMVSSWPASWTSTSFHLNGLDATDSYQPGRPVLLDDTAAEEAVIYREAYTAGATAIDAVDVGVYLRGADSDWHGGLATEDTGSAFAAGNLPPQPDRGAVQSTDRFRWFTRDTAAISGPFTQWADVSATGTGQWASQAAPLRPDRTAIGSRMLFGNTRGRVRIGRDRLDALYSGSRLDLASGGWPAGIEAIFATRVMPPFYGIAGFEDLRETDHFDLVQIGWTHPFPGRRGALEARYQYSTAHLDTSSNRNANVPVHIDLLDPSPAEAPLANLAVRTRHEIETAYQSGDAVLAHVSHRFTFGGGWQEAQPRNRFHTPPVEIVTAGSQPGSDVRFDSPAETHTRIDTFTASGADTFRLPHRITLEMAFVLDAARGAVAGAHTAISWTSPSPRIGFAVPVPRFSLLTLRGNYTRTYARLAGRYLDFADPESLSALVFDTSTGALLQRFGGAYSGVAPSLKRPYADEFNIVAELALPRENALSVRMVRRDERHRLATVNTGVPDSSYRQVPVLDPGPDSLPGTFDDQEITVYAQSPATLGQDRYLLTNPDGLRERSEAVIAALRSRFRFAEIRASFTALKCFGPTNPGNSVWVNDPGVVGALYSDPNSLLHAAGHPFLDRAFIGKFQSVFHVPQRLGGIHISNILNYFDGLAFARQLLITGLPQGPFFVDATLRGSPEGGNRAQYVPNWNLRIERNLQLRFGQLTLTTDLLNVLNNGNKVVESALSGPQFNQRPALAIAPPRNLRLGLHWDF